MAAGGGGVGGERGGASVRGMAYGERGPGGAGAAAAAASLGSVPGAGGVGLRGGGGLPGRPADNTAGSLLPRTCPGQDGGRERAEVTRDSH